MIQNFAAYLHTFSPNTLLWLSLTIGVIGFVVSLAIGEAITYRLEKQMEENRMGTPIDSVVDRIIARPDFSWNKFDAWLGSHPDGNILEFGAELEQVEKFQS